jgi:hemerythrin superfamily protein
MEVGRTRAGTLVTDTIRRHQERVGHDGDLTTLTKPTGGTVDALELLTADHNRVRGLFALYREAEEADKTDEMAALADKIVTELEVHTTIEEEIFYPAVHDMSEELAEVVDEGVEEHHVAKVLIQELATVETGGDQWKAKLMVLIENVEHHAEEEEQEMFPQIRSSSDASTRESLGQRLETRKTELGAPTAAGAEDLSIGELRDLAKAQQIPGRSKMDAEELRATVDPRG